jgi:acyl-coenzyme A synthetase/AMP-(fatty) acid ligase
VLVKKYSDSVILIIAYVVCKPGVDFEGLKHHMRKQLPDYMIPNHFQKIEEIPVTPNGKADRKALPEPALFGNCA